MYELTVNTHGLLVIKLVLDLSFVTDKNSYQSLNLSQSQRCQCQSPPLALLHLFYSVISSLTSNFSHVL